jgi:hypothetical protein
MRPGVRRANGYTWWCDRCGNTGPVFAGAEYVIHGEPMLEREALAKASWSAHVEEHRARDASP